MRLDQELRKKISTNRYFMRWLQVNQESAIVGVVQDPAWCPVAMFLRESLGALGDGSQEYDLLVQRERVVVCGIQTPTPNWLRELLEWIDTALPKDRVLAGADAKKILAWLTEK